MSVIQDLLLKSRSIELSSIVEGTVLISGIQECSNEDTGAVVLKIPQIL